ncbi:MAG: M16 family metallopeptidase, partial [Deltaproteobacteria bacterium]
GNMSSRLFNEVREKRGLAYAIASHVKMLKDGGVFYVHAGIDRKNFSEAARVILAEARRLKAKGVTGDELRRAKEYLTAQAQMAMDDAMEHMLAVGEALMNTGTVLTKEEVRRRIERVTASDVLRVARRFLVGPSMRLAAVGPRLGKEEAAIQKAVNAFE